MEPFKILLADDQEDFRELSQVIHISRAFRGIDYAVFEARDGEEALRILGKEDVGLAVLDISMPKKTGIDVVVEDMARGANERNANGRKYFIWSNAPGEYVLEIAYLNIPILGSPGQLNGLRMPEEHKGLLIPVPDLQTLGPQITRRGALAAYKEIGPDHFGLAIKYLLPQLFQ